MNEESGKGEDEGIETGEEPELLYDLTSARDAARLLRVSESTIWRWIEQDIVPAYRMGNKRVFLRRSELESLIKPVRKPRRTDYVVEEDRITRFPMTAYSRGDANVVTRARALQQEVLDRRGGKQVTASWEDINEARDMRADEL